MERAAGATGVITQRLRQFDAIPASHDVHSQWHDVANACMLPETDAKPQTTSKSRFSSRSLLLLGLQGCRCGAGDLSGYELHVKNGCWQWQRQLGDPPRRRNRPIGPLCCPRSTERAPDACKGKGTQAINAVQAQGLERSLVGRRERECVCIYSTVIVYVSSACMNGEFRSGAVGLRDPEAVAAEGNR